ncbi:hypothetical protein MJO29_015071 [Puccinia striiformis f. sp. tritici]|nr:hypothetical protein MJO29_015071 [Puccinia striiformis f. sp. tritici]
MCISVWSCFNNQIQHTSSRLLRLTSSPNKAPLIPQINLQNVEPLPQKRPQSPPDFPSPTEASLIPQINFQNVAPLAQKHPQLPPEGQPHSQACWAYMPWDDLENHYKDLLSLEEPTIVCRARCNPDLTAKRPTRRNQQSKPSKSKAVFKPHSIYDDTLVDGTDTDMDSVDALIQILPQQVQHIAKHPSVSHQQLAYLKNQSFQFSLLTPSCGGDIFAKRIQVDIQLYS